MAEAQADAAPRRGRRPSHGDPVVDRALAILGAFDATSRRLSLSELARRTGIPLSTVSRLAGRLEEWGALHRHASGGYSIGLRLWQVASLAEPGLELRELAAPILDDLSMATRFEIQLAVLEGCEALVLDRRRARGDIPVSYRVGGRLPLVPTAVGRVLLAFGPPEVTDEVLAGAFGWPLHQSPRPSPHEVRQHLARIHRDGVAVMDRPDWPVSSIAVPVRDPGGDIVAALGIVLPAGATELGHLHTVLRTSSLGITRQLSASGDRRVLPPWRY